MSPYSLRMPLDTLEMVTIGLCFWVVCLPHSERDTTPHDIYWCGRLWDVCGAEESVNVALSFWLTTWMLSSPSFISKTILKRPHLPAGVWHMTFRRELSWQNGVHNLFWNSGKPPPHLLSSGELPCVGHEYLGTWEGFWACLHFLWASGGEVCGGNNNIFSIRLPRCRCASINFQAWTSGCA